MNYLHDGPPQVGAGSDGGPGSSGEEHKGQSSKYQICVLEL